MKILYSFVFSLFFVFVSCDDNGKKNNGYLPNSVGNINALQVVISDEMWNGEVGDAIRTHFAAAADGLPQDEPLFSMSQIAPESFQDFVRTNRIFIHVTKSDEESAGVVQNKFAKPQTGAIVQAPTEERIVALIEEKAPQFIQAFHNSEIAERQKRTRVSTRNVDSLRNSLGIRFEIPSAYRLAATDGDYFWYRKDLKEGEMNVLIYSVPSSRIASDSTAVRDIIDIRDTVGSAYIPVEDDDQMITEQAYAPFLFKTTLDGREAYLTKGIWELASYHMAGPFINYAVKDVENDRYIILEGFIYAPMVRKRNLQFELESILMSTTFYQP